MSSTDKCAENTGGTVLLHCWTCWASRKFRGRISNFVPSVRTPPVGGGVRGRCGTFEVADAGNTGRDGTFQNVSMSDFCRGLCAPQIHGGAMAGTVPLSSPMLETLARNAPLFTDAMKHRQEGYFLLNPSLNLKPSALKPYIT